MRSIASYSTYRNEATDGYCYSDLIDYGYDDNKEDLIPKSTVTGVIDKIETDVNEIIQMLEGISGLTEIDEAMLKLSVLSRKLY